MPAFWILKTEPNDYSFEDLLRDGSTHWDGVRNYQARNNLKAMQIGDICLIYHSVGPKEIAGIAQVTKTHYQDPTSQDERWVAIEVSCVKKLSKPISLSQLKANKDLIDLPMLKQSRLSVSPLSGEQYRKIINLSKI